MLLMDSRWIVIVARWGLAFGALAGIVSIYRFWLHVNPTTVALTLLVFILMLAAKWSLRAVVVVSFVATACYNFYFLPPVGQFTISDPENWLSLFVFLATAVVGSRLSRNARDEAEQANASRKQLSILFTLSRELLQTENIAALVNSVPELIKIATFSDFVVLYLLGGDRLYQAGNRNSSTIETPHFRQLALTLSGPETNSAGEMQMPIRAGVRPRGLLLLRSVQLSPETFQAIGGLVAIALDRAQALEDVARSEASKESERLRTLILDSITHELRTPLTSIKGAASTLLSVEGMAEEDRRELITIVDEESDRLNRLVSQAVEMAQIEAQELHMNFTATSVADLMDQARKGCTWVFNKHPVNVDVPPLHRVLADAELVGKVLCNLLENAAKYSEDESPIFISTEQKGGYIFISVADRGVGIDPMEQTLIFDRLYRSRSQAAATPGTGMGLAISKSIIEAHHGTLTVTSQPKHGSVFTFSLPLTE